MVNLFPVFFFSFVHNFGAVRLVDRFQINSFKRKTFFFYCYQFFHLFYLFNMLQTFCLYLFFLNKLRKYCGVFSSVIGIFLRVLIFGKSCFVCSYLIYQIVPCWSILISAVVFLQKKIVRLLTCNEIFCRWLSCVW